MDIICPVEIRYHPIYALKLNYKLSVSQHGFCHLPRQEHSSEIRETVIQRQKESHKRFDNTIVALFLMFPYRDSLVLTAAYMAMVVFYSFQPPVGDSLVLTIAFFVSVDKKIERVFYSIPLPIFFISFYKRKFHIKMTSNTFVQHVLHPLKQDKTPFYKVLSNYYRYGVYLSERGWSRGSTHINQNRTICRTFSQGGKKCSSL